MQNLEVAAFEYSHRGHILVPENELPGIGGRGIGEPNGADKSDEE
jgi:hypothetical protein